MDDLSEIISALSINDDPAESANATRSKATKLKKKLKSEKKYSPKCIVCGTVFLCIPALCKHVKKSKHRADKEEIKSEWKSSVGALLCAIQAWESIPAAAVELKRQSLEEFNLAFLNFKEKLLKLTLLEHL